jgi:hypothetical protein
MIVTVTNDASHYHAFNSFPVEYRQASES